MVDNSGLIGGGGSFLEIPGETPEFFYQIPIHVKTKQDDITISSNTTWGDRTLEFRDITVNAGVTLNVANNPERVQIIRCRNFILNGTLEVIPSQATKAFGQNYDYIAEGNDNASTLLIIADEAITFATTSTLNGNGATGSNGSSPSNGSITQNGGNASNGSDAAHLFLYAKNAISLQTGCVLNLIGGTGGTGGNGNTIIYSQNRGGNGGSGGNGGAAGFLETYTASLVNNATLNIRVGNGGNGGNGGNARSSGTNYAGGNGGNGGRGYSGGNGGFGGQGALSGSSGSPYGGNGGNGGDGITTGGNGGNGGNVGGTFLTGAVGGNGGPGGDGVISGGNGGNGGNMTSGGGRGGSGGNGGDSDNSPGSGGSAGTPSGPGTIDGPNGSVTTIDITPVQFGIRAIENTNIISKEIS